MITIESVMSPAPTSIEADAPLAEARRYMRRHDIRHLPVTRDGALVGLLSDRDIKLVLGPDFDYPCETELSAGDVAMEHPYVADVGEPLERVAQEMAGRHVGSALVTREGRLAGIFTATDACRALAKLLRARPAAP